jgi:hypothetical protein
VGVSEKQEEMVVITGRYHSPVGGYIDRPWRELGPGPFYIHLILAYALVEE